MLNKGGEGSGYTTEAGHRGIPKKRGGSLPRSGYHGSNIGGLEELNSPDTPIKVWLSADKKLSEEYARAKTSLLGGKRSLYKVNIGNKNLLKLKGDMNDNITYSQFRKETGIKIYGGKYDPEMWRGKEQKYKRHRLINSSDFVSEAMKKGYEGIYILEGGTETIGLFSPQRVRSLVNNKGGEGSGYTSEAGHRGIPEHQGGSLPAGGGDVFERIAGDGRRFTTTEINGFSSKTKLTRLRDRTFFDNPDIDSEEKRAVGMYQADGYMAVNEYLRKGEISETAATRLENQIKAEEETDLLENGVSGALDDLTAQIDSSIKDGAIELVPTEEDPLIRGMLINDNDLEFIKNITTPGTEFEDKGFVSTTLWNEVAWKFMRPRSGKKSFRALIVSAASGSLRGLVLDGGEAEILLPRGSRFRVLRAEPPTEGDSFSSGGSASSSWTIYLEAL